MVEEKRYQVFVSSTYTDLTKERAAVIQSILRMDHLPAGMEMFPSADDDQWELIKQVIDQSDYYVVVVAGRYGSIIDADGISYTEKEYDYAVESGIPVLGFVHKDPGSIPDSHTEHKEDARELLELFREKVKSRPVNFFGSPEELGGLVVTSLIQATRRKPRVGWIRGDKAMTVETEKEILDLRKELDAARTAQAEAERSLVEDTTKLAQGEDEISIPLRVKYFLPRGRKWEYVSFNVKLTWDEIFGSIGALLIDEATVEQVKDRCDDELVKHLTDADLDEIPEESQSSESILERADWETVEFQLRALGLIDSGVKKRGVQDDNKYLKLTSKGLRHLAILRAIKRPETSPTE
ncbi:DUF4062 domain-containing protein [Rhodococcus sp. BP-332]|uniref:DUF4062 domain-containing protein n=1 Tax=Rhodococcus sp. BP-332 TaxID=2739447 RepID=UPI001C9A57FA|nr:DUF4062 domain-containing protein [Rhodococcus sp. BP-332]MBY6678240.1 DUF4062 domain-containing protein [Rhodococcus sp. BP-332]